ncbi:MAG: alpha-amylase family glycosyl hydrolase, partial [Bacteroidota bacterium]
FYANGPKLHDYLHEMNKEVLSKYDIMTVGETPGVDRDQALLFVDEDREELNMFFHFELMSLDREGDEVFWMRSDRWKLTEFKKIFSDWDETFAEKGWGSLFLSNHDNPRTISRWGNDSPEHWYNSATMLQTFLLTMKGTPYFYYGDEIGMSNIRFDNIKDYQDINTLNRYALLKQQGMDLETFIENEKEAARDNGRTPMQWNETTNAGFSQAKPWLKVHPNHKGGLNVADQEKDENSVLNYFRKIVQVRKDYLGLVYGDYTLLLEDNEQVYAYTRILDDEKYLVLLSFSTEPATIDLSDIAFEVLNLIISNDSSKADKGNGMFELQPYQACVFQM